MSILEITPQFRENETHTSQTLVLDGIRIRLDTYTNLEDSCWYFDVFDDQENALVQGIAIVTGLDLLFPYHYFDTIPPGILFVQDQSARPFSDPLLPDFLDDTMALYYQEVLSGS